MSAETHPRETGALRTIIGGSGPRLHIREWLRRRFVAWRLSVTSMTAPKSAVWLGEFVARGAIFGGAL